MSKRRRLSSVPFDTLTHDAGMHLCEFLTDKDYRTAAQACRAMATLLLLGGARASELRRLSFATRMQIWSRTRYCIGNGISLRRECILGRSDRVLNVCQSCGARTRRRVFDSTLCEGCTCDPRRKCFMVRKDAVLAVCAHLCAQGMIGYAFRDTLNRNMRWKSTRQGLVGFLEDVAWLTASSPQRFLSALSRWHA